MLLGAGSLLNNNRRPQATLQAGWTTCSNPVSCLSDCLVSRLFSATGKASAWHKTSDAPHRGTGCTILLTLCSSWCHHCSTTSLRSHIGFQDAQQ